MTTFKGEETELQAAYYGVAIDSFTSLEYAVYTSPEARLLGCAGYLVRRDKYYLLAAVYPTAADAEKVLSGLNEEGACLIDFNISKPSFKWCDGSVKRASIDALGYADTTYNKLYELSVDLDTAAKTKSEVVAEIGVLYNQINAIKVGYEQNLVDNPPFESTKIIAEITTVLALLDGLKQGGLSDYGYVGDLRYAYTLTVYNYSLLTAKI